MAHSRSSSSPAGVGGCCVLSHSSHHAVCVCVCRHTPGREKDCVTCGAKEIERKLSDELGVDRIVQFYQKTKQKLGLTKEVPTRERDFLIENYF